MVILANAEQLREEIVVQFMDGKDNAFFAKWPRIPC